MRKAWIVLGLLLSGANEALSSEDGAIIPPGGSHGAQAVFAGAKMQSDETKDVVLVGTVTKIYPVAGLLKRWAVVIHVDRVVSGEFPESTFTFKIHSPSRAGLRVRRTYVIKVTRDGEGYVVDEFALEEVRTRARSSKKR